METVNEFKRTQIRNRDRKTHSGTDSLGNSLGGRWPCQAYRRTVLLRSLGSGISAGPQMEGGQRRLPDQCAIPPAGGAGESSADPYDDLEQLQEVARAIRKAGGKINSQCGIHMHIDAEPFDGRKLGNLAKVVYKQEPLILHALGINSDRLRRYTRPISDELIRYIE